MLIANSISQLFETLPDLTRGKIDVWFAGLDLLLPEIKEFEAMLSPEEAARALRFKFLRDRNRYIVRHGVLRSLLAGYLNCGYRQVAIRSGVNGKPYLASDENMPAIHLSLSHSDAFAAFAFSRIGSIGVDIEKTRDVPDMLEIVERHFTSQEKRDIFSCPESLRSTLFYKLWTRKEAVLKAQGEGLLRSLDCVDVATSADAHGPWKVLVTGDLTTEEFWVSDADGPAGFATAVAAASPFIAITMRQF